MELLQKALFNLPRATGATGGATAGDISRSRKSYFTFNIQILRNYDTPPCFYNCRQYILFNFGSILFKLSTLSTDICFSILLICL